MSVPKVIQLFEQAGFDCLPCQRQNLDFEASYRVDDTTEFSSDTPFETHGDERIRNVPSLPPNSPSLLRYFIDGSRKTYRVYFSRDNGRLLPVIAAQIGVGVLTRDRTTGRLKPVNEHCSFKYLIVFPDTRSKSDFVEVQRSLATAFTVPFEVCTYKVRQDKDPKDSATQRVMEQLRDLELDTVGRMANSGLLDNYNLLVRDGPLEFQKRLDTPSFRNVIGVSKTFSTMQPIRKGLRRQDVGNFVSSLELGQRSTAYRSEFAGNQLAHWFIRIRNPNRVANPLDGIVKLSRLAADDNDRENGFETDLLDNLSGQILQERNVTPYGSDYRWASHLYPIYLTEKYIKSRFLSDLHFNGLF